MPVAPPGKCGAERGNMGNRTTVYSFVRHCLKDPEFNAGGIPANEERYLSEIGLDDYEKYELRTALNVLYELQTKYCRKSDTSRPETYTEAEKKTVRFTWYTKDGKRHEKRVDYEKRLDFINWLETTPEIVGWT